MVLLLLDNLNSYILAVVLFYYAFLFLCCAIDTRIQHGFKKVRLWVQYSHMMTFVGIKGALGHNTFLSNSSKFVLKMDIVFT